MLTANYALRNDLRPRWTQVNGSTWRFQLDALSKSAAPANEWRSYTFAKDGEYVYLDGVANSGGTETSLETAVDELLRMPHEYKSVQVDRCIKGGKGYEPAR